jgi:hypothetical protein
MWTFRSDYTGSLPPLGDFDVSRSYVFQDQYSNITLITAKEGKIQHGPTEDKFCDSRYHVVYSLGTRGNSMLTQLSKLSTFAMYKIQQVSAIWKWSCF